MLLKFFFYILLNLINYTQTLTIFNKYANIIRFAEMNHQRMRILLLLIQVIV